MFIAALVAHALLILKKLLDPKGSSLSSSAVVERPHNALCPSVVSLNEIITRAEHFIIVT